MAQKEVIEFVAKVDDQTNQIVPDSQVNTPVPQAPVVPVNPNAGLQDAIVAGLEKDVAEDTLAELIQSSVAREAQLRVLRELQDSIKAMEAAASSPPPPIDPPTDIPTGFFDPEDNGEIPDYERIAQEQQDAIDDLIRSFSQVGKDDSKIDLNYFDDTTAEFDDTFAKADAEAEAIADTMASLEESLASPLETLGLINPQLTFFLKGLAGATAALSSLVVASELYSSVLAATIENFGELSADVKRAQSETELDRIRQRQQFADELGPLLADLERERNELRENQTGFLAHLLAEAQPFISATTAGFNTLMATLDGLLTAFGPVIDILQAQAKMLEHIFNTVTWAANRLNPFKWFQSDDTTDNSSVWDELTKPDNFLNVQGIRPKNINGRDVYDMDDLMDKNL